MRMILRKTPLKVYNNLNDCFMFVIATKTSKWVQIKSIIDINFQFKLSDIWKVTYLLCNVHHPQNGLLSWTQSLHVEDKLHWSSTGTFVTFHK